MSVAAEIAASWIGTPYQHQASLKGVGCDCLGLVRGVRAELGFATVPVPAYAPGWGEIEAEAEPLLDAAHRLLVPREAREPASGDVLVFRMIARGPAKHCGIALGPDRFVHAQAGVGTVAASLSEPWRRRLVGIFAFPEPEDGS